MSLTMLLCGKSRSRKKKRSSTLDKLDGEGSCMQNQNTISRMSYLIAIMFDKVGNIFFSPCCHTKLGMFNLPHLRAQCRDSPA